MSLEMPSRHPALERVYAEAAAPREVQQAIVNAVLVSRTPRPLWPWVGAGLLAPVALAALLVVTRSQPLPHEGHPSVAAPLARATTHLLDGHRVSVGEGSEVHSSQVGQEVRLVLASGTVHCDVRPLAPGERFVVRAPEVTVSVVGTAFEVTSDGGCSDVRVFEGVVEARGQEETALLRAPAERRFCREESVSTTNPTPSRGVLAARPAPPEVTAGAVAAPEAEDDVASEVTRALVAWREGRFDAAEAGFTRYLQHAPDGELAEEALFYQALSRREQGDVAGAQEAAWAFVRRFGAGRHSDLLRQQVLGGEQSAPSPTSGP